MFGLGAVDPSAEQKAIAYFAKASDVQLAQAANGIDPEEPNKKLPPELVVLAKQELERRGKAALPVSAPSSGVPWVPLAIALGIGWWFLRRR
jgi:hypothetical protein